MGMCVDRVKERERAPSAFCMDRILRQSLKRVKSKTTNEARLHLETSLADMCFLKNIISAFELV